MLDRYYLEHELGTGARGAVYRGRDRETGRVVAIKLIPGTAACRAAGSSVASRDSADAVALLSHPHIPALYETGRAGYLRYVVMEFAEGVDLRAYTEPCTLLPLRTVLSIAVRVVDALQHAHEHGVVHGDIKPANIVFDPVSDRVKVADFTFDFDHDDVLPATAAYSAPEQLCGSPPSSASDQFSVATTLYQLSCGRLPFTGRSRPEIVYRIVNEGHADVRVNVPSLPAALSAVLDRALAKEPAKRYPSAGALKEAIGRVQAEVGCTGARRCTRSALTHGLCAP
jgi:serine/threonine-protein kinase